MTSFKATDELGEMNFETNLKGADEYKGWRIAHLTGAWIVGSLAIVAAAGPFLEAYLYLVITLCALVGGGLLFSYTFQLSLHELFIQLGVREKFAAILLMCALALVPRLFGIMLMSAPLLVFLLLSAFLCYNAASFGRFYAFALIIVCREVLMTPFVPVAVLVGFMVCLVLTFWLEFVAFRLQAYGKGRSVRVAGLLLSMLPNLVLSTLISVGALIGFWVLLMGKTQMPVFTPRLTPAGVDVGPQIYEGIIWDVLIIVLSIVGLILLMHWIEKKFRYVKKELVLEEGLLDAAYEGRFTPENPAEQNLSEVPESEARARILQRFRQYAQRLGTFGWRREEHETPGEYLHRTAYHLLTFDRELDPKLTRLYNNACYSPNPVSEEEANSFVALASETEEEMTAELLRLKDRAEFLDDLKRKQNSSEL